jgi:hypothetical protein
MGKRVDERALGLGGELLDRRGYAVAMVMGEPRELRTGRKKKGPPLDGTKLGFSRPRMRTGLSRQANASLSVRTGSPGKGLREPETFCPRIPPSPAAETGKRRSRPRQGRGTQGFLQRPQETGFARECVVGPGGLEPPTKRL